jgi:hypothetical protein
MRQRRQVGPLVGLHRLAILAAHAAAVAEAVEDEEVQLSAR